MTRKSIPFVMRRIAAETQLPQQKGTAMKVGKYTIPEIRKFLVAASGIFVILLNSALDEFANYLAEPVPGVITTVVGIATAVGVFLTKNAPIIDAAGEPST